MEIIRNDYIISNTKRVAAEEIFQKHDIKFFNPPAFPSTAALADYIGLKGINGILVSSDQPIEDSRIYEIYPTKVVGTLSTPTTSIISLALKHGVPVISSPFASSAEEETAIVAEQLCRFLLYGKLDNTGSVHEPKRIRHQPDFSTLKN